MLTKRIIQIISGFLLAMYMFLPQLGHAAKLTFGTAKLEVGAHSDVLVDVLVDPQKKTINAVEGTIQFSGAATDGLRVSVENGQSALPIWPTPPQYDEATKSITFVGGVPLGFNAEVLLFRIRLIPAATGVIRIDYSSGTAYLNDGKGTKDSVNSQALKLEVSAKEVAITDADSFSSRLVLGGIILLSLTGIAIALAFIYRNKKTNAL